MDRQEFDTIGALDQIKYINELLVKGESLRSISAKLGIGKTTIRDRFKKAGYSFNAEMKQYCKDNTLVMQEHKSTTKASQQSIKPISESNTLELQKYKDDLMELINCKDDLLEMLKDHKRNTNVIELPQLDVTSLPEELQDTIISKSIKVYGAVYKLFDGVCSHYQGIKKQDLISLALLEFYNKYNKK